MGLIREIQNIQYSLNRTARNRIERENKKIELENYNRILHEELSERFRERYKNSVPELAYKTIIQNYYAIIQDITAFVNSLTETKDGKEYYIYKNRYNITTDLENFFFQDLNKIKRIYENQHKQHQKELTETLENRFKSYFVKYDNKLSVAKVLQEYDTISLILDEITSDENDREFLKQIYYKSFNKIYKMFKIEIQEQKDNDKYIKQQQKEKQQKVVLDLFIFNQILAIFLKSVRKCDKMLK